MCNFQIFLPCARTQILLPKRPLSFKKEVLFQLRLPPIGLSNLATSVKMGSIPVTTLPRQLLVGHKWGRFPVAPGLPRKLMLRVRTYPARWLGRKVNLKGKN